MGGKSNKTDDYILLGDADVQDVGITDATMKMMNLKITANTKCQMKWLVRRM